MTTATETPRESTPQPLQPVLGTRLAFGWWQLIACVWFSLFFVYLSYIPLFHSDIWGHVLHGIWILDHRALPTEDPHMPLSAGMRVVDTAWLSQVILGWFTRVGGESALSSVFAVTVLASYLLQTRAFYLFSRSLALSLAGMGFSFFVGFSRHAIIRPEIFGMLCLSLLLWMIVRLEPWASRTRTWRESPLASPRRCPPWLWLAIPLLFAFWANAHGSFAVGLLVLACHAAGRVLEVAWSTRSLRAVCSDRQARQWILLTELAVGATLLNPYGLDLLAATAKFGSNPNLRDVLEWFPLRLIDMEGIQFAISVLVLIVLLRHSRQRVRAADVLILMVFAGLMAPTVRMIGWYAPLLTFVLMPHLTDLWQRLPWPTVGQEVAVEATPATTRRPQFTLTLVALLAVWCAFALSPISRPVLGGKPRQREQILSRDTPLGVAAYLREHRPEGLVFAPQWWGDWLLWDVGELSVFMTTNVHLVPAAVWGDYLRVARGRAGWEDSLDRYRVKTLVVHKKLQENLTQLVRRSPQWRIVFEDDQGIVAERTTAS